VKFSVIIPTYNGSGPLRQTLRSLERQRTSAAWEVIVVVNNSTDDTDQVLSCASERLAGRLRIIHETEQGHCAALNAGIRVSRGNVILVTNHDVTLDVDWLEEAGLALERFGCHYVGGRVLPLWRSQRPAWLPDMPGLHWAVLALLDYGTTPMAFGERMPIGCNMAFTREAFSRAGLFDNRLGRRPGTLIGQDVREWGLRARAAGLTGMYAPRMIIHHEVPTSRMTKRYFRRWMYWHGVSRAILYQTWRANMERPEDQTLDFTRTPHILGVPRYLFRSKILGSVVGIAKAHAQHNVVAAFEHEMQLCFMAGVIRQRWKDRRRPLPRGRAAANAHPRDRADSAPGVHLVDESNRRGCTEDPATES
jgi:glucosyl-dolichyl phosphate glucuronosyltransferase